MRVRLLVIGTEGIATGLSYMRITYFSSPARSTQNAFVHRGPPMSVLLQGFYVFRSFFQSRNRTYVSDLLLKV